MVTTQEKAEGGLSMRLTVLMIILPIIVGAIVIYSITAAYWMASAGQPIKGGVTTIICDFVGAGFHLIPFLVIAFIVKGLINTKHDKTEIYIRLSLMLIPATIVTAYWLHAYTDPLAQGFLPFINLMLIFVGHMLGMFVYTSPKNNVTSK